MWNTPFPRFPGSKALAQSTAAVRYCIPGWGPACLQLTRQPAHWCSNKKTTAPSHRLHGRGFLCACDAEVETAIDLSSLFTTLKRDRLRKEPAMSLKRIAQVQKMRKSNIPVMASILSGLDIDGTHMQDQITGMIP